MEQHEADPRAVADIDAKVAPARLDPDIVIARAAGLLAGRVGCPVDDAHTHLLQLAAEQCRDPADVAGEVLAALQAQCETNSTVRAATEQVLAVPHHPIGRRHRPRTGAPVGQQQMVVTHAARKDEEAKLAERVAQTERLGNLGWGEWDLITDATLWSKEMYRIYERDPVDGPVPCEMSERLIVPEDQPISRLALERFERGEAIDILLRIRVGHRIKHVRVVADAVRDVTGRPLKVYGIVQDVTAQETSRAKLAEVEERLREHQQILAAEHRLTVELQQIVLPIPAAPVDLPGLRAAVRYISAEQTSRIGGDWFGASCARDGSIILAIGDVSGHGLLAATTMAQLRHGLAALTATITTDPAVLMSHLNELMYESSPAAGTATAVVARYEPCTGTMVWAQSGHPAVLHSRAGTTTELARPQGPLLGAIRNATYTTARAKFSAGDLLVFYTDGLIENRTHSLAEGLTPVITTLNRFTAEKCDGSLDNLLAQLHRANPDDDTCILAALPVPTNEPMQAGSEGPVESEGPVGSEGPGSMCG